MTVPLQAWVVPRFWTLGVLQGMGWHGRATAGTGCARLLAVWAQKFFFVFFESCSDNYLQNDLKQTKTNKKRLNAWVASHEALV